MSRIGAPAPRAISVAKGRARSEKSEPSSGTRMRSIMALLLPGRGAGGRVRLAADDRHQPGLIKAAAWWQVPEAQPHLSALTERVGHARRHGGRHRFLIEGGLQTALRA